MTRAAANAAAAADALLAWLETQTCVGMNAPPAKGVQRTSRQHKIQPVAPAF
jgi:hypothetical protein